MEIAEYVGIGTVFEISLPHSGTYFALDSLLISVTTSSDVGNRRIAITVLDGNYAAKLLLTSPVDQPANTTSVYHVFAGAPSAAPTSQSVTIPWPENYAMPVDKCHLVVADLNHVSTDDSWTVTLQGHNI